MEIISSIARYTAFMSTALLFSTWTVQFLNVAGSYQPPNWLAALLFVTIAISTAIGWPTAYWRNR